MKRKITVLGITVGILLIGAILSYLVFKWIKIPCVFYQLTGLQCPGCGNTRATMALLKLDFNAMLRYNLLYPLEMIYILRVYSYCALNYIRGGRFAYHTKPDWFDITVLVLILVWTVVRNIFTVTTIL